MQERTKLLLISFVLSLPLWWGVNILGKNMDRFFVFKELEVNPQIISADLAGEKPSTLTPTQSPAATAEPIASIGSTPLPEAKALISAEIKFNEQGNPTQRVIYEKAGDEKLPIASLTKLMTALIVLDNFDLSQRVIISDYVVSHEGEMGQLKAGDDLNVEDLLYIMLMESSNDAAYAFAEVIGQDSFVALMNQKAELLGLENTHYSNPAGLDISENYSSAEDLVKLASYILQKSEIVKIISTREKDIYDLTGNLHHKAMNTNQFLGELPEVVGGKTGYTARARQCLLVIVRAPENNSYFVNVVLGSEDRFGEMRKLIDSFYK